MKITLSFFSSRIVAHFSLQLSFIFLLGICVPLPEKLTLKVKRKRIQL